MHETIHGAYTISTDPARLDEDRIHQWLSTEAYWALGRSREKQDRALGAVRRILAGATTSGTAPRRVAEMPG